MASHKIQIPKRRRIGKKKRRPVVVPVVPPALSLPQAASATLLLDLRASQIQGLSEGDPVSTWMDKSGGGHDFTQSGSARPTYRAGGGVPYVEFDGVDDSMTGPDFADNLDSFTVFFRFIGPPAGNVLIGKINNIGSGAGWLVGGTGTNGILTQEDGGSVYSYLSQMVSDPVVSFVKTYEFASKNSFTIYNDGVQPSQTMHPEQGPVVDMSTSEPIRLGTDALGSGDAFASMVIAAVLLYAPAPSSSDRAAIDAWLATNP